MTCNHPQEFLVKQGIRKLRYAQLIQRWHCKKCNHHLTFRGKYAKMKFPNKIIENALQYIVSDNSLRITKKQLKHDFGYTPSHSAIYHWIKKYLKGFHLPKSRPHRQETKDKISLALHGYNKTRLVKSLKEASGTSSPTIKKNILLLSRMYENNPKKLELLVKQQFIRGKKQ